MLQWNVPLLGLLPKCIMVIHVYAFCLLHRKHEKGGLMLADVGQTLN